MRVKLGIYFASIILLVFFSGRKSALSHDNLNAVHFSCEVTIKSIPYKALGAEMSRYQGRHVTCPYDPDKDAYAKIYVLDSGDRLCSGLNLLNLRVMLNKSLPFQSAIKRAADCNPALGGNGNNLYRNNKIYVWSGLRINPGLSSLPGDASYEDDEIRQLIYKMGLLFVKYGRINDIFCFEMPDRSDQNPISLLKSVGYSAPSSVHQEYLGQGDCKGKVYKRFKVKFPVVTE